MNSSVNTPTTSGSSKTVWAVVAVLCVVVLAMGAALIRIQAQPQEPRLSVLPAIVQNTNSTAAEPAKPAASAVKTKNPATSQGPATIRPVPAEPRNVTLANTPQVVHPRTAEPAVARPPEPAKSACANCGTVESVTPIESDGTGSGVGAVAGGVLGAVVGNQVGGGNGKTLATIVGAVGGGIAGNTVEKRMNKVTLYEVMVRMDDGSVRNVRQSTHAVVGSKVTVDGDTLLTISR